MSVDRTIEELTGTLSQLGVLVEHINTQIIGISSRINLTLDNFDHAVAGIATDAGLMTGQVGETVSQVPNSWVFYVLFISLIVVLVLLAILIILSLIARIYNIYKLLIGINTALPSLDYSESKQPLKKEHITSPQTCKRLKHIAVPMEAEPKRYGFGSDGRTHPIDYTKRSENLNYAASNRIHQTDLATIDKKPRIYCQNVQLQCLVNNKKRYPNICTLQSNLESISIAHSTNLYQSPQIQQYHYDNVYLSQNAEAV